MGGGEWSGLCLAGFRSEGAWKADLRDSDSFNFYLFCHWIRVLVPIMTVIM